MAQFNISPLVIKNKLGRMELTLRTIGKFHILGQSLDVCLYVRIRNMVDFWHKYVSALTMFTLGEYGCFVGRHSCWFLTMRFRFV